MIAVAGSGGASRPARATERRAPPGRARRRRARFVAYFPGNVSAARGESENFYHALYGEAANGIRRGPGAQSVTRRTAPGSSPPRGVHAAPCVCRELRQHGPAASAPRGAARSGGGKIATVTAASEAEEIDEDLAALEALAGARRCGRRHYAAGRSRSARRRGRRRARSWRCSRGRSSRSATSTPRTTATPCSGCAGPARARAKKMCGVEALCARILYLLALRSNELPRAARRRSPTCPRSRRGCARRAPCCSPRPARRGAERRAAARCARRSVRV